MEGERRTTSADGPPCNAVPLPVVDPRIDELDTEDLELVEALGRLEAKFDFDRMYLGALLVLRTSNPLRYVLAAHGLRELMEKLPQTFPDVPNLGPSLKQQVIALKAEWAKRLRNTVCFADGHWEGPIDPHLRKGLSAVKAFFDKFTEDNPDREVQAQAFLSRTEPGPVALPTEIMRLQGKEWWECRTYFVAIAHHRRSDVNEFEGYRVFLRRFLLSRFSPRTYSDRKDLDALIDKVEGR